MSGRGRRAAGILAVAVAILGGLAADLVRPLPSAWFAPVESRRVLDRTGGILAVRRVPERGHETWVALEQVAPHVVDALIATEDHRFADHHGVDPIGIGRALWAGIGAGRWVQGGSTLTQQTARLLAGRPRGLPGKVVEAWRAVKLEQHLTKREILVWYLNRVGFGRGTVGIEAAAREVFDESAATLSVAEGALLVGLLPAPERLHPRVDLPAAVRARDRVLGRMVATGRLSVADAERARAEPVQLRRALPEGLAPHLVARLLDANPEQAVFRTPIDPALQRDVEDRVRRQIATLHGLEVDHAAVVVVDVPTGEVLAYVGSAGWDRSDGQVDGVRAPRSPGSALKPFVYALALERGWRPADVVYDVPRRYTTRAGSWVPENYSRTFRGPLRLREALATSANVPAVRLLDEIGPSTFHSRLQAIGFALPEPTAHYGLGLALGDAEVTLEALTAAYAGLARGGRWRPLRTTTDGPVAADVSFVDPGVAAVIGDILSDPLARGATFGRFGPLERPYPAAVKTGTSTGYRDNWTVGYTDRFAVGVWVGNFDGRPMGDVTGVTGAGPLWASVMDRVTAGRGAALAAPVGWSRRSACALSGAIPGPYCTHVVEDWVPEREPDRPTCTWHTAACRVDWPPELASWAHDHGEVEPGCPGGDRVSIAYPADGTVLYVDPRMPADHQRIPLRAEAAAGTRIDWAVDGQWVAASNAGEPVLWRPGTAGAHEIVASVGSRPADTVRIEVRGNP